MENDNSAWDFWDKVYSSKELRQKIEKKSSCEISMVDLLKSKNLCRAELIVFNVPRIAPPQEGILRNLIKMDLRVDVPIISIDILPKKWIIRFYRHEDAQQVQNKMIGYVYRCRVLHPLIREVNRNQEPAAPSIMVEDILPEGLPNTDRNVNWSYVEWIEIQSFKLELYNLLRRHSSGLSMDEAIDGLKCRSEIIAAILDTFPIALFRIYNPQIRLIGRYLCLPDQENITSLVHLAMTEKTSRKHLDEWEPILPSDIRTEQQLLDYFARLLAHFGPQHITMSLAIRLAASIISPIFPRSSVELTKKLVDLSPSFILINETLYLATNVRHRRLLVDTIAPTPIIIVRKSPESSS